MKLDSGIATGRNQSNVHKFGEDKRARVKLTSIGKLFQFEINMIKLLGGYMLDERFNWYFAVAYKIFVTIIAVYSLSTNFFVYDRTTVESKSSKQYIKFFLTLQRIAAGFATFSSIVTSVQNKRLISILLGKQIDERYFKESLSWTRAPQRSLIEYGRGSSIISSPAWPQSDVGQVYGLDINNINDKCSKDHSWALSVGRKDEIRAKLARIRHDFGDGSYNRIPKVHLARLMIVSFLLLAAINGTFRAHFVRDRAATSTPVRSESVTSPGHAHIAPNELVAPLTPSKTSHEDRPERGPVGLLQEAMLQMTQLTRPLARSLMQLARIGPTFLKEFLLSAIVICQLYGQTLIALFITLAISDALRQARHVQLAHLECDVRVRGDGRLSNSVKQSLAEEQRMSMRMTELLTQVRDVLLALRSAESLNLLFLEVLEMSIQMGYLSLFISVLAGRQVGWLTPLMLEYLALFLGSIFSRLGYTFLHSEVREISLINEQRIISSAVETQDLIEQPIREESSMEFVSTPVSSSAPVSSLRSSGLATRMPTSHNSLPSVGQPQRLANDKIKIKFCKSSEMNGLAPRQARYLARMGATTNFRLAREIEQLWPTDWFPADVQSYISRSIFVITFVATLQQLVEAGAKLRVPSEVYGGGLGTNNNSAPALTIN